MKSHLWAWDTPELQSSVEAGDALMTDDCAYLYVQETRNDGLVLAPTIRHDAEGSSPLSPPWDQILNDIVSPRFWSWDSLKTSRLTIQRRS